MKILDCESIETIYGSIYDILGITQSDLEQIFKEVDLDSYYSEDSISCDDPEQLLFSLIAGKNTSIPLYDRVCWFHLTRTHNESTFDDGILTLNEIIESIWNFLFSLIKGYFTFNDWQRFRNDMGTSNWAYLYRLKVNKYKSTYGGPFAVLIKDFAFKSEKVGNHNYLKLPEIIEDICMCFQEKTGIDLCQIYCENTKPCIVKFWHDNARANCITTILYYLYNVYNKKKIKYRCGTNFDGYGKSIPKENIIYVQFPDF